MLMAASKLTSLLAMKPKKRYNFCRVPPYIKKQTRGAPVLVSSSWCTILTPKISFAHCSRQVPGRPPIRSASPMDAGRYQAPQT